MLRRMGSFPLTTLINMNKTTIIDLTEWCSPTYLAAKLGFHVTTITNWVARGRIDTLYVEQLSARLVHNIDSISQLRPGQKKAKKKV
jgi:hypothetical protein